jgi:hypothetical protein
MNTAKTVIERGNLHDYKTGRYLRAATTAETLASITAAESDGGVGAFDGRDGTTCYVTGGIVAFRFGFGTHAIRGTIEAASLEEAYAALRALMTGGCATTIWVESPSGRRLTMGENAE